MHSVPKLQKTDTSSPADREFVDKSPLPRVLGVRTVAFYARDWISFTSACRLAGVTALPASAETLQRILAGWLPTASAGALSRRLCAIAHYHRQQGLLAPIADPAVKSILRTARHRTTYPRRLPPPSPAALARRITDCPGDLAGLRDRAFLLLMQATDLGRADLINLDAEQMRFGVAGLVMRIRHDDGAEQSLAIARQPNQRHCPVKAMEDWLKISQTSFGAIFRKVDRWDNISYHRLGVDAVRRILARRGSQVASKSIKPVLSSLGQ